MKAWIVALGLAAGVVAAGPAGAQSGMIVEKKTFEMPSLTTEGGATIRNVKVGWESYGTLNADKSNAILVTHFFSATSHAAGKYSEKDGVPGYWDTIIGPGKAIDTDKYFVLSSDTIVNLNANSPTVVTTGPASTDPATGKPYGMSFPVVSIRDMVTVEKALVDSLGIAKLRAVVGPSMGALQAYEWAVHYPDSVERIVPVIGAAGGDPFLMAWLDVWAQPIRLDPNWKGGAYHGGPAPDAGVAAALKVVSLHANQAEWARETFGRAPADPAKDPARDLSAEFKIVAALNLAGSSRASGVDANHMLYLARANQLAAADPSQIKVPTLLISSPTDLVFPPAWIERTAEAIAANGTRVERGTIVGPNGHLNGVLHIAQAGPQIAEFLARPLAR